MCVVKWRDFISVSLRLRSTRATSRSTGRAGFFDLCCGDCDLCFHALACSEDMSKQKPAHALVAPKPRPFAGCFIYVDKSVRPSTVTSLSNMLSSYGGRLSAAVTSGVTHILAEEGEVRLNTWEAWRATAPGARVVKSAWLAKSLALDPPRPLDADAFALSPPSPPSPPPLTPPLEEAREGPNLLAAPPGRCAFCLAALDAVSIGACFPCLTKVGANETAKMLLRRYESHAKDARNQPLVDVFKSLLKDKEARANTPEQLYNATQAFAKIAALLRSLPFHVTCETQLLGWPGFATESGKCYGFAKDFLSKGAVERDKACLDDAAVAAKRAFMALPWVGVTTASEWVEDGLRSIPDVVAALRAGKLRGLRTCEAAETLALATLAEDGEAGQAAARERGRCMLEAVLSCPDPSWCTTPIGESECAAMTSAVASAATAAHGGLRVVMVGGRARGSAAAAHDLDLLVTHDTDEGAVAGDCLERLLAALRGDPRVAQLVCVKSGVGPTRDAGPLSIVKDWAHTGGVTQVGAANIDQNRKAFCLLRLREGGGGCGGGGSGSGGGCARALRRVDIVLVPRSQLAFAQLGWTGTRQFLRWMRRWAAGERVADERPATRHRLFKLSNHALFVDERSQPGGRVHVLTRTGKKVLATVRFASFLCFRVDSRLSSHN